MVHTVEDVEMLLNVAFVPLAPGRWLRLRTWEEGLLASEQQLRRQEHHVDTPYLVMSYK
jgi:hypothetical protein